jgi:hypothetical protein
MRDVTFYHSVVCPRCQFSGLLLARILRDHPDIRLHRVEVLTNRARARRDGVRSIPALVSGNRTLTGVVLTSSRIRGFLQSLEAMPSGNGHSSAAAPS